MAAMRTRMAGRLARLPTRGRWSPQARWASSSESNRDYFEALSCEKRFDIDMDAVHDRYKKLMTECHPDKQHAAPRGAPRSRHDPSLLTEACAVLKDPALRAKHLLEIHGCPLSEESSSLLDQDFLMSVLEVREELDATTDAGELRKMLQKNEATSSSISSKLTKAFDKEDLDEAARLTACLQCVDRIGKELRSKLDP